MDFKAFLERNGINTAGCEISYPATPVRIFFLADEYLRKTGAAAELPEDLIRELAAFAEEIQGDPLKKALAWHLYRLFCLLPEFKELPDHIDLTGERTGLLYLIIMLSIYPHLQLRMKLEGLPEELADRAMPRCTSLLGYRSVHYPGEKGLLGRALPFVLNYKNNLCFRLGRFDYVFYRCPENYPELFRSRRTGRYTALCRAGWCVDQEGFLLPAADETVSVAKLIVRENAITGRKIDLAAGKVTPETVTVDLNEYERLTGPDSYVLLMHIPGGGGMTLEKCKASFIEAREFCRRYFPEIKFAVFGCISWVFNPVWREYLPESNMTKLQQCTLAFPAAAATERSGLFFVFARDDGDPAAYPQDNSLRRAMIKAWNEKGILRSGGMLLPFDEIDNFPLITKDLLQ